MRRSLVHAGLLAFLLVASGCGGSNGAGRSEDDVFSAEAFADPPPAFRPETRWWWPGGAVEDEGLVDHLRVLRDRGYGAVEIQPFMSGITYADLDDDDRIRTVGDAAFLDRLHTAACAAEDLGLFWDLTLGSGWSTGGVNLDEDSERQLVAAELTLSGPSSYAGPLPQAAPPAWIAGTNAVLPAIDGFDEALRLAAVLAAEVLDEPTDGPVTLGDVVDLSAQTTDGVLQWEVPAGAHRVFAIYENRTQHFPAGAAYPGALEDARVIDHLDRRGIDAFIGRELTAWIDAVQDCPPRAVFVDSFELVGELPWTTSFSSTFQDQLGYAVEPLLPFLFLERGESEYVNLLTGPGDFRYRTEDERGIRAREDYEHVRGASFAAELLSPIRKWLHDRDIELRLQAHGGYADVLDAYGMADVPESESLYAGGSYDFLRLASSAAEVAGKRFASNETFPRTGTLELSEIDARILMGRAFSAGINRLVHHGNAYPYPHTDGRRWYPFHPLEDSAFATGPLDISFDIHPEADIWASLLSLNRWAARLSYASSRGEAVNEVAWLHPEQRADNFASFGVQPGAYESETSVALRQAGFSYARISRSALASSQSENGVLRVGHASFRALLVDGFSAGSPELLEGIDRALQGGVPVVWIGPFPERADGLVDASNRDARVRSLVSEVQPRVRIVTSVGQIPGAIEERGVAPSVSPVDSAGLRLSVTHRKIAGGDLYVLFNESYEARTESLHIGQSFGEARLLDPETGNVQPAEIQDGVLTVALPAAHAFVLWLASDPSTAP